MDKNDPTNAYPNYKTSTKINLCKLEKKEESRKSI